MTVVRFSGLDLGSFFAMASPSCAGSVRAYFACSNPTSCAPSATWSPTA